MEELFNRYNKYRSYGHSKLTSTILAPTFLQITIVSCIAGTFIGLYF